MSRNTPNNYLRTFGYVLKRTNYGESDRILNIITPSGKVSAIAKGVRREKSKLAGGIEVFSLIDVTIHKGKGELGIITSAKMIRFYGEILKDLNTMEIASGFLKKINIAAESSETEEYFDILGQSLIALNAGDNSKLVEAWFLLNLNRAMGEEINLYRDIEDNKLEIGTRYSWDQMSACFKRDENGEFGEDEIKVLRLIITNGFNIIRKIKMNEEIISRVFELARVTSKM
ncbi:DNA repair protein RecO [Candidatus Saccharibacteria bacterium]|nr:DNA repair protein RecO [Candidatus Saccharibacteria bacterium]